MGVMNADDGSGDQGTCSCHDLMGLSAAQIAADVRRRELSPVEVVSAHIEHAKRVDASINAIAHERFHAALEEARHAERMVLRGETLGPLHGVPCTVKEGLGFGGLPHTAGSTLRLAHRAKADATVIARIRAAGAIVIGLTNQSEMALWPAASNLVYGRTENPWCVGRSAGGSSGGEAAIVATGGSVFGIGTDGGGSIRIPAAYCGVFGHKPSSRTAPLTGHVPLDEMFGSLPGAQDMARYFAPGPMARRSSAEHLVLQLLYQLIVILLVTRGVVWLSRRFLGQTAVAGEILAGLVLGPSLLGKLFPEVMHAVFVPETSAIFVGIAQVGLILLMFQIGMEFDFKVQLRQGRSAIAVISIVGVAVPFSLGFVTAPWLWETLAEPRPDLRAFRLFFATAISGFVHVFFIPVFFAYTGLRTDVGSLATLHDWVVCGLVCLLAFVAKFGGTYIASRIMGESRRSAAAIGVSMNTRALMELIALNIGYDLGVLPKQTFTMLVIMAIASTFIATPLIRRLMQDQRRVVEARSSTVPMVETITR